jgi:phosphoglycolate phosphatase
VPDGVFVFFFENLIEVSIQSFLAIFDCDGTLVDSQGAIVSTMKATFIKHGLEPPESSEVRRIIGLPLVDAVMRLSPGVLNEEAAVLSELYKHEFRALRRTGGVNEPMFPGVSQVLAELDQANWTLGIATGKASHGLVATLEPHGILDYFVTQQTSDVAKGKPHPDMVRQAMKETDTRPETTVMIGDTTFDMEMAKSAGVKSIGVSWGYHKPDELYQAGAAIVIDGFEGFAEVLRATVEEKI